MTHLGQLQQKNKQYFLGRVRLFYPESIEFQLTIIVAYISIRYFPVFSSDFNFDVKKLVLNVKLSFL
jgi:hypothetical protein